MQDTERELRPTSPEERAAEGVNALLIKVEGLEADVGILERRRKEAEAQRDSLKAQMQEWMEGSAQLQVKLDDAVGLLERVRPILCGLAIEVEQKQKAEGSHYLTDAVAVKDAVVALLAGLDVQSCEFGCTVDKGGQHHPGCAEVVAKGGPA